MAHLLKEKNHVMHSQTFIANNNVSHLIFHNIPFFDDQMNMWTAYLASLQASNRDHFGRWKNE